MRVLLFGNSQMFYHNLPRMLEYLTASAPANHARLDITAVTEGGASLESLWNKGEGPGTPRAIIREGHFDRIVCAHELGLPKEQVGFWTRLHAIEPFMREGTLFVDDSVSVLRAARDYGMTHLCAVLRPDTSQPARSVTEFAAIHDFSELMPVA